jgi:lipopolysaccharide assembly outer membrane protein LptD (OstA)
MFSDRLTVNFDRTSKKLAEVVAEGHVKVKRGRSYTLSEKAIYKDSTKSAQLLGRPQIIIDPQELDDLNAFQQAGGVSVSQKN